MPDRSPGLPGRIWGSRDMDDVVGRRYVQSLARGERQQNDDVEALPLGEALDCLLPVWESPLIVSTLMPNTSRMKQKSDSCTSRSSVKTIAF